MARVIAWVFGVSPVPIARVMNRATSETLQQSSTDAGPRPIAGFLALIINRYIHRILGEERVQFVWATDEVEKPETVVQRHVEYAKHGIMTLDQIRAEIGQKPYGEEFAKRPFILTGTGIQFLDQVEEDAEMRRQQAAELAERLAGGGNDDDTEGDGPTPPAAPTPPANDDDAQKRMFAALSKWRRNAITRARQGKPQKRFDSDDIPDHVRIPLEKALGVAT